MATLYITQPETILKREGERLTLSDFAKNKILDVPLIKVDQVIIFGNVTVTTPALTVLLEKNINLCFLSTYGRYKGSISGELSKNCLLRMKQYEVSRNEQQKLNLSLSFIRGKLSNMKTMLQRYARQEESSELEKSINEIKNSIKSLDTVHSIDSARGHEGNATRSYFDVFGLLIKNGMKFSGRVRRPPTDPVNSLLSFGYTLLANDVCSAVNIVGFDPYIGFLHSDRYGRPSLALDLMEEFRPIIVDSLVLTLLNNNMLKKEDFQEDLGGIYIKDDAKKVFLRKYDERKKTEINHPVFDYKASYQRCMELQARLLGKFLTEEIPAYPPFKVK